MKLQDFFNIPNAVYIGSRALDCFSDYSDYDICVLKSEADKFLKKFTIIDLDNPAFHMKHYMNILPLGNAYIVRKLNTEYQDITVDLLIYENQSDLNILRQCVDDIKLVPNYLLQDKNIRVNLFEKALLHYGFRESYEEEKEIKELPPIKKDNYYIPVIEIDDDDIPF